MHRMILISTNLLTFTLIISPIPYVLTRFRTRHHSPDFAQLKTLYEYKASRRPGALTLAVEVRPSSYEYRTNIVDTNHFMDTASNAKRSLQLTAYRTCLYNIMIPIDVPICKQHIIVYVVFPKRTTDLGGCQLSNLVRLK